MKVSSCLAVCFGVVTFSSAAFAESGPIGAGGRFILSADRLFGLTSSSMKVEVDGGATTTESRTDFALLWRPVDELSPSVIPQIGLDVGVLGGLTVGGAIGFATRSGTDEVESAGGASASEDVASTTAFLFAPRVGYGIPILPWLAFWGRLGITYYNRHTSQDTPSAKGTVSGFQLNLDPTFVFIPAEHFGITAGPYLDLPLSGSRSSETTLGNTTISPPDDELKFTAFGLKAGLLGAFL